tara:strand:- start:3093 stop:5891 length:2799 start_codon:yes stop_codon:yes gene_type:complete
MKDNGDGAQVPAALIDISNNDMPTMHVPSRDSMFRPDLSSDADDEEVVEYVEKEASGLLSPLMSISYEFYEIADGFGIQNDQFSYANEDIIEDASIPDVNSERESFLDDNTDNGYSYNKASFYYEERAGKSNMIKKYSGKVEDSSVTIDDIDKDHDYKIWIRTGGSWVQRASVSGGEFYVNDMFALEYRIFFSDPYIVLSSDIDPNALETSSCNSVPTYEDWFLWSSPVGETVPYYHIVVSGDNISCIAESYSLDIEHIDNVNKNIYEDWDIDNIEIGTKVYLVDLDLAKKIHKTGPWALFEDICDNKITVNNDGGREYKVVCDPNNESFLGSLDNPDSYIIYCNATDTVDKDSADYSELCDPNSEWYVGRLAGNVSEDGLSVTPGERATGGEVDFRSEDGWNKYIEERERLQSEAAADRERQHRENRAKLISELKPYYPDWLNKEGDTDPVLFNEDWTRYLTHVGISDDVVKEIYSHEVLIYEGRLFSERPTDTEEFAETGLQGRRALADQYPLCYEKQIFPKDINIEVDGQAPIVIRRGHYSLRKCIPEEGSRRIWDHIQKKLVPYHSVSYANVVKKEFIDPRDLPPNDIYDSVKQDGDIGIRNLKERARGMSLDSYTSFTEAPDSINIISPEGKTVYTDYHRARSRLLEMAAVNNLELILSTGLPEEERCFKGFFKENKDPCFNGWCMPDAMTAFVEQNYAGFDRYALKYNPFDVDEVAYQTGWEIDTTPWPTETAGRFMIASTFMKQRMSSSESGGNPYATLLPETFDLPFVEFGEEVEVAAEEWPHLSHDGKSVVEFSMPLRIIRINSRDSSLNREQRLLKTLIDLHKESNRSDSVFDYSIYFILPDEAFNPFKGECNFITKYFEEYVKLSGEETGSSILHDYRKDSHSIDILKDYERKNIEFHHTGPKFDFNQVEEFYLKWKSAYL